MPPRRYARKSTKRYRRRRATRNKRTLPLSRIPKSVRPELKYSDNMAPINAGSGAWAVPYTTNQQDFPFSAAGFSTMTYCLNSLDQGTGKDQRLGWKVRNRGLAIRAKVTLNAPAADYQIMARARYRIMIFMQKDYSGTFQATAPTTTDLLQNPTLSATNDSAITSHKLDRFKDRFAILHDRIYSPSLTKSGWLNFKINKRLNSVCQYSSANNFANGAMYATHGAIYFHIMFGVDGDESSPTVSGSLDLQSRFFFNDA